MVFSAERLPKKYKTGDFLKFRSLVADVPGAEAMAHLFEPLRGVLFCLKNRDGVYLWANQAFLRRTGIGERAELIGRRAKEVFPALLAAGYEQQDASIFASGKDMSDRLEMITNPDGRIGWYLTDKVRLRDRSGKVCALASTSRDLRAPVLGDPGMEHLFDSIEIMRRNFAEPLRIADLARASGMSLSKFERLMRSVFNLSPRQFLTSVRVEAAVERLRSTEDPLSQIALECGFCDQPTFSRQFKATTGLTASRYRALSGE